jgi:D-threonate/D-erythronate kinase
MFQRESRLPVRSISLEIVRGDVQGLRNALSAPGAWIAVADAETDADLDAIATVGIAAGIRLFSGSSGLSNVLARRLPIHQLERPPAVLARELPILIVAGSRHRVTERQIELAVANGAHLLQLEQTHIDEDGADLTTLRRKLDRVLDGMTPVVVTSVGLGQAQMTGTTVASRLAEAVAIPDLAGRVGGLVLTGGEVAAAICSQIGVRTIWLRGEVLPAIPWASVTGEGCDGLPIVTKAGSFGPDDAIQRAIEALEALRG